MFDLASFLPRAVMQGIPLLYGSTGEILTEKSGNLNLGIPGVMYPGDVDGAAEEEQFLGKGGFTRVGVGDDREGAAACDLFL